MLRRCILYVQTLGDLGVNDTAPTIVVQSLLWSSDLVCLGDPAIGGNFVCCLIIVVKFIGLRRAYMLGEQRDFEVIVWVQATKGWDHFYVWNCPVKTPCEDFNLANRRGLGCMRWVKSGEGKSSYFMQLFLFYILFGKNFDG